MKEPNNIVSLLAGRRGTESDDHAATAAETTAALPNLAEIPIGPKAVYEPKNPRPSPQRMLEYRLSRIHRLARRRGFGYRLTVEAWLRLCHDYDDCCAYCGEQSTPYRLTVDHFIPMTKGGRHEYGNLIPACYRCNHKKRDKVLPMRPRPGAPLWAPYVEPPPYVPPEPLKPPTDEEWAAMPLSRRMISVLDFPELARKIWSNN